MRRSDAKQVRRRLACTVLRVTASLRDVERRLNLVFMQAQQLEAKLAAECSAKDREIVERALIFNRSAAENLSELATWYKAGFEQLTQMTREIDAYISWYDTVEG